MTDDSGHNYDWSLVFIAAVTFTLILFAGLLF